jgi:hypothetical protein
MLAVPTTHLSVGLFTAMLVCATHTLFILFLIVTGRVLKEAMRTRALPVEFLAELNQFFARKKAYPAAVLAATFLVATAVLGYANRSFGLHPSAHVLAGVVAFAVSIWALALEQRELLANQDLIDRAALALDALDRARQERGEEVADRGDSLEPGSLRRAGWILAVSAWMPYAYWGVVEWRGDFARVSLHPWMEASLCGLLLVWLSRGAVNRDPHRQAG